MTDPRLLVPLAALPGFDSDELKVKARGRDAIVLYDEVHDIDETTPAAVQVYNMPDLTKGDGYAEYVRRPDVVLDFSDSATRDKAARWLASLFERSPDHVKESVTAPRFESVGDAVWRIETQTGFGRTFGPKYGKGIDIAVPELEETRVDWQVTRFLALALVCQHVGGAS